MLSQRQHSGFVVFEDSDETNGGIDSTAATSYGYPIGLWNVSLVTNFSSAFAGEVYFNEDISAWVSKHETLQAVTA